ncbi:MAG: hypothetical protein GXO79_05490 [Chlorobi bacterium]|nr:hypothetical protein [Chlorobiota bacterium]
MAYTFEYLLNHDIDIFFEIEGYGIHIATAGAEIPREVAMLDALILENKAKAFDKPLLYEIEINPYLEDILNFKNSNERDLYLNDFKRIARKGFITFDKTDINNFKDPFYHVVAWPNKRPNEKNELETPKFISKKININIIENISKSRSTAKLYDKFEIFKGL